MRVLCIAVALFFFILWLYIGVLRKSFITLTENEIQFKTLFFNKKIKWTQIADVQTFYRNKDAFIGIITKEKLLKQKDNLANNLSNFFGGIFSLSISLKTFPTANLEKLFPTIVDITQRKANEAVNEFETESSPEIYEDESEPQKPNFGLTFLRGFLISIISGIIYGLSIYFLHINFIILPVIGLIIILLSFIKFTRNSSINFLIRLIIGLLCTLQVLIAPVMLLIITNQEYMKANGFIKTLVGCTISIFEKPSQYFIFFLISIILFICGACYGLSFKFTKKIKKHFMKKQNGFYIEKDKRYMSIYLTDYAEYNSNVEKEGVRILPNRCLIEKQKKTVLAFYIPLDVIKEFSVEMRGFERVKVNDIEYYKLDLGGSAEPKLYGFHTMLILNQNKQIDVLELEID